MKDLVSLEAGNQEALRWSAEQRYWYWELENKRRKKISILLGYPEGRQWENKVRYQNDHTCISPFSQTGINRALEISQSNSYFCSFGYSMPRTDCPPCNTARVSHLWKQVKRKAGLFQSTIRTILLQESSKGTCSMATKTSLKSQTKLSIRLQLLDLWMHSLL